jgi:hypothetical protein
VPGLIVDPVLIPFLLPILPLEGVEPLAGEEIGDESDGPILEVLRDSRGWE